MLPCSQSSAATRGDGLDRAARGTSAADRPALAGGTAHDLGGTAGHDAQGTPGTERQARGCADGARAHPRGACGQVWAGVTTGGSADFHTAARAPDPGHVSCVGQVLKFPTPPE